jgi:ABC-2 type transport system ATP-binding protein
MIEVRDLTRTFGETEAVSRLNFRIQKGDIVGFLGPNGAGKTTTLRMITGFLPPTEGEVVVNGRSSQEDGKAVRRQIGYLPENNPLYEDLRVREYLAFRAELKGIRRKDRPRRIGEVLEACDALEVRDRIIGACSKGFRQRVGLADALLADPPFLILDEPTVGLDPAQIAQTRALIKGLSADHTVLLSTHILPEVEAICTRALILHRGRLLFDGSVEGLRRGLSGGQLTCTLRAAPGEAEACLREIPGVARVRTVLESGGETRLELETDPATDVREAVVRACSGRGLVLLELAARQISLEEAFLSITTDEALGEASP